MYQAKIIADSISEAGDRLTTFEVTFPRIVLAEFNTHRMLSRNSASSRAIPVAKQIQKVLDDPFIPIEWGKNQKGMQADEEVDHETQTYAELNWLGARDSAVRYANELTKRGIHKQITNRLLEPFMWQTCIVTATEWSNFFALRANPQAQPEIRKIAEMMKELYQSKTPKLLGHGDWHLPYVTEEEHVEINKLDTNSHHPTWVKQISAARCARVSYLTQDGKRDIQADLDMYERLVDPHHLSPLEHVATPIYFGTGAVIPGMRPLDGSPRYFSPMVGNFKGWKQLRKFIENEDDYGKVSND